MRGVVAGLELTAQAVEPDAVHARQLDDACREEGNLPLPRAERMAEGAGVVIFRRVGRARGGRPVRPALPRPGRIEHRGVQVDYVRRHIELDSAPVFMDLLHPLAKGGDAAQVFAWQKDSIRAESAEVSRELAGHARPPPAHKRHIDG